MAPTPYYQDEQVTLYHGDSRELLPALDLQADLLVVDPPYGETALAWDRWPDGWPTLAASVATSMWCFGSMRMFLDRNAEFATAGWRLSQDVVWEKANGTGFATDRFRRVHEHALHWYRGPWRDIHQDVPREAWHGASNKRVNKRTSAGEHTGKIGAIGYDSDTRLARSVMRISNLHQRGAVHPTEKPIGILDPLIQYGCPVGGLVLDLFAGSGSTLDAARQAGRRAVGIEADERYVEAAARRLSQATIPAA